MAVKENLHIVCGSSRARAEQARVGFELGHHCEVYADVDEFRATMPQSGIVLAADEGDGVSRVLAALEQAGVWLPVIATAPKPEPSEIVAAIKAGALDYLLLPLSVDVLSETLAVIAEEHRAFVEARQMVVDARSRISSLTPREQEVLDWLAEGCTTKVIARELDISPRTVEVHRANMMDKLGVNHSAEAIRLQMEASLLGGKNPNTRRRVGAN